MTTVPIDLFKDNPRYPLLVTRLNELEERVKRSRRVIGCLQHHRTSYSWTYSDEKDLRIAISEHENALKELSDMRLMIWKTALKVQNSSKDCLFD